MLLIFNDSGNDELRVGMRPSASTQKLQGISGLIKQGSINPEKYVQRKKVMAQDFKMILGNKQK
jgi:hypothetical protein